MGDKMKKELPGIYKNPIDHPVKNNKELTYVKEKEQISKTANRDILEEQGIVFGKDINKKIHEIFRSSRYIYKAQVEIQTKEGRFFTNIIGKNRDSLITMKNEQIPISEIIDIKMIDEKTSK